jgi:AraC family transcriptional regulator
LQAWKSIRKSLEYIEENIAEDIEIEQLAESASLSLFYYQRLFSRLVGKPVREYIKFRRLARACDDLKNKNNRVIDVALKYGFVCHDTFTRAFKEAYGLTPMEYRNNPVLLKTLIKPDLSLVNTKIEIGVPFISEGLVLEINRQTLEKPIIFAGITGSVEEEKTGINIQGEIWNRFYRENCTKPLLTGERFLAATYDSTYFLGSVLKEGINTEELAFWTLPARDYTVCGFEAETADELHTRSIRTSRRFCELWMKNNNIKCDDFKVEIYYNKENAYAEWWFPLK